MTTHKHCSHLSCPGNSNHKVFAETPSGNYTMLYYWNVEVPVNVMSVRYMALGIQLFFLVLAAGLEQADEEQVPTLWLSLR